MIESIQVPHVNPNETSAKLVRWHFQDASDVKKGDALATLETTKASFEIESPLDGILCISDMEKVQFVFGETIAWICTETAEFEACKAKIIQPPKHQVYTLTNAAKQLVDKHDLNHESLLALNKKLINEADVKGLISTDNHLNNYVLSEVQQQIAKTVSLSKSTIPDAFIAKKISVGHLISALPDYNQLHGVFIGLAEIFAFAVSRLHTQFPLFFGRFDGNSTVALSTNANIGITVDAGKGLAIPVIHQTELLSLNEIGAVVMNFRYKSRKGGFKADDLVGGNFSVSLNMEADTLLVRAIIVPNQTCILSLGAVLTELKLNSTKGVEEHHYMQIGLTYDHRIFNGSEASAFLTALKKQIEDLNLN